MEQASGNSAENLAAGQHAARQATDSLGPIGAGLDLRALLPADRTDLLQEIESLFSRDPEPNTQFRPFSEEEFRACQALVEFHPNIARVDLSAETIAALTSTPPQFNGAALDSVSVDEFHREFAKAALNMACEVLSNTASRIARTDPEAPCILVPVWRAGLSFLPDDALGFNTWHLGAARDPQTLRSSFYHIGELPRVDLERAHVVVADPFVGTAWTAIEVLEKVQQVSAVPLERIHLAAFAVTPEGATRLMSRFESKISITAAHLDSHLNERGWVISNRAGEFFGDFGDLFSAHGLATARVTKLRESGLLDQGSYEALQRRLAR